MRTSPVAWSISLAAALWLGVARAQAQPTATSGTAARAAAVPTRVSARSCRDTLGTKAAAAATVPTLSLAWREGAVPWTEWPVQLGTRAVPVTVVVARLDPARLSLSLDIARNGDALGAWNIDRAPESAAIAFNAGQFTDGGPWGWVVHRGREWQPPGAGALAAAIVVDSAGRVRIAPFDSIAALRERGRRTPAMLTEVVQSYPELLRAGRVPVALCRRGAIDREHRDIRLALGVRDDGQVIVALTRYAPPALVPQAAERLPIGPTTLEMAELMWRLGSRDAVMLDGGLSAQLRITGAARTWPGLRSVPLAFIGTLR